LRTSFHGDTIAGMARRTAGLRIRPERAGDEAAIRAVNDAAFGGPLEGGIVDGIRGTDRWVEGGSLVAEAPGGRLLGHLLISRGDLVGDEGAIAPIWLIGPVAVLPEHQREGIGTELMERAIALAIEHEQPALGLLGHAAFYGRFGFRPARALGIEPPRPWPDEHWLVLPLPARGPSFRGTVLYPQAFGV
jgi:predicted N-acetyltransferase YhbS